MKYPWCFFLAVLMGAAGQVQADIFEHGRPADTALRDVLVNDRQSYYVQTSGIDHQEREEKISEVSSLSVNLPAPSRGLQDMDKALELYLREQLQKDRDYKNLVALNHPLLLLEYSSPVLADVIKHYRVTSYERLGIEQTRLNAINLATEGSVQRLSLQSERECLKRNESRGLVAAMRLCQNMIRPLENLTGLDGMSLQDGRRNIHVVRDALARLGFDKARIDKIVNITGDKIISNDRYEEQFPSTTFEARESYARQILVKKWRDVLEKFGASGRASPAGMEDLSLPGVPVTKRVLEDISLLGAHEQGVVIFKLASYEAFFQTQRMYRQATGYLTLCLKDPALVEEFRRIIGEKRDLLLEVLSVAEKDRSALPAYKDLLASVAQSADVARERLRQGVEKPAGGTFPTELMLNF